MDSLFNLEDYNFKRPRKVLGCSNCSLKGKIAQSNVKTVGKGKKKIAIIFEKPSMDYSEPYNDSQYRIFLRGLGLSGINMLEDCKIFNLVRCSVKPDKILTKSVIDSCSCYINKELKDFDPEFIIAVGDEVINYLTYDYDNRVSSFRMFGRILPRREGHPPIGCIYDVDKFVGNRSMDINYFNKAIKKFVNYINKDDKEIKILNRNNYKLVKTEEDFKEMIEIVYSGKPVAFDYETNSKEPFSDGAKILTAAFAVEEGFGYCLPIDHPDFTWKDRDSKVQWMKDWLQSDIEKYIQNWSFEEQWSRHILGVNINNVTLDTMVLQHLVDNRPHICSQDFQIFVRYGDCYKNMVDQAKLEETDINLVAQYNVMDVRYLIKWAEDLKKEASRFKGLMKAYQLFHDMIPIFCEMTSNGMKIDVDGLDKLEKDTKDKIDEYEVILNESKFVTEYETKYKTKYENKPNDNRYLFFDIMGLTPSSLTDSAHKKKDNDSNYKIDFLDYKVDKETLNESLNGIKKNSDEYKFVDAYLNLQKYKKLYSTYIKGIKKCIINGFIHPSFLLHTTSSLRGSSAGPNFQNIPAHDSITSSVRTTMKPTNDYIMQIDYGANEVKYIAALSGDENLIRECNEGIDFHKYFVAKILNKDIKDITKEERFKGKNGFVFPTFYGSNARVIAKKQRWPENSVKRVEGEFWRHYKQVRDHNEEMELAYKRDMYLTSPLGFYFVWGVSGPLRKENIYNTRVQATAFHRLLKAIKDIHNEYNNSDEFNGFKSKMIGQIHDCLVWDIKEEEIVPIAKMCYKHMTSLDVFGDWDAAVSKEVEFELNDDFTEGEEYSFSEIIEKFS